MNRSTYNKQHTDLSQQITALAGTLQQRESALTADWNNDKLLADATQAKLKLEAAQRALQALEAQEPTIKRDELLAQQKQLEADTAANLLESEKVSTEVGKLKSQLQAKTQHLEQLSSVRLDYRHTLDGIQRQLSALA